ncbi:MAG TPA: hypothetical protein VES66_06695, partial [Terriglobales bacterium]|nr:hypothetical protein [Terriglobales bacterium]
AAPITAFLNADQLAKDVQTVTDAARGRKLSLLGMALAVMRNYDPFKTTTHFTIFDLLMKFDKGFGASKKARSGKYGKVLKINHELVTEKEQDDLDRLGIAKNAREEKLRARDAKQKHVDNEQMMKLYRKVVLKEPTAENFVSLNSLAAPKPVNVEERVGEEILGD